MDCCNKGGKRTFCNLWIVIKTPKTDTILKSVHSVPKSNSKKSFWAEAGTQPLHNSNSARHPPPPSIYIISLLVCCPTDLISAYLSFGICCVSCVNRQMEKTQQANLVNLRSLNPFHNPAGHQIVTIVVSSSPPSPPYQIWTAWPQIDTREMEIPNHFENPNQLKRMLTIRILKTSTNWPKLTSM